MEFRKKKIYLDTSVISAIFDERKVVRQKITHEWWHKDMSSQFEPFVSQIVLAELGNTKDLHKRDKFRKLVQSLKILELNQDAKELADSYVSNDIIPEEYYNDALHIAIATVHHVDTIVSWNFEHLVNPETKKKVRAINLLKNYPEIDIESPEELGGWKYE